MKNLIYIFTFLFFLISNNLFAKDKLITIYDKDCGFSQELINGTYQKDLVKTELSTYDHLIFEAKTEKAINYIKEFKITAFPTQIAIIDYEVTIYNGFLNPEKQIEFLYNPNSFVHKINSKKKENIFFNQDYTLTKKDALFACRMINLANRSTKDPFTEFMKVIGIIIKKNNLTIENPLKFAFDNLDKLICNNNDTLRLRDFNTILKYAIDTGNHDFMYSAIFIKENGKNICNPYIDFNRIEIIDGEAETLIQFIDKLLDKDGIDAFHDIGRIRDIKNDLKGCSKGQLLFETHELQNLSENELKQIRLEQSYFFNKTVKYYNIGYYSRRDKKNKFGLIDRSGSLIIPFEYENVSSFGVEENGLITVSKNGKWGFINLKNEIIIPLKYENSYPRFDNGKARVEENGKSFYIDKTGKCVEDCE